MTRRLSILSLLLLAGCVTPTGPIVTPHPPAAQTFALTVVVTAADTGRPLTAEVYADNQAFRVRANSAGFLRREGLTAAGFNLCAELAAYVTACQPVSEARSQVLVFSLKSTAASRPTRAQVLDYKGCLGTLRDSAGRAVWTPALPGAPDAVRDEWLWLLKAAGCTHIPIGPFGPGPSYPGIVSWDNPDWRNDAAAIRGLVTLLLDRGFVPVVFTDGGPRDPKPRLRALFPVLSSALDGIDGSVIVAPAGWEPVVGDFTSAEVSWALETWHALRPNSIIAYHGSPGRLVGSSNCNPREPGCTPVDPNDLDRGGYESDDPWRGGESEFYKTHGGQYIQVALYQTPHGRELYEPCNPDDESGACWANRWQDYVERIGAGKNGWRVLKIVLFEVATYETTRGQRSAVEAMVPVRLGAAVCQKLAVQCGFGDGAP